MKVFITTYEISNYCIEKNSHEVLLLIRRLHRLQLLLCRLYRIRSLVCRSHHVRPLYMMLIIYFLHQQSTWMSLH